MAQSLVASLLTILVLPLIMRYLKCPGFPYWFLFFYLPTFFQASINMWYVYTHIYMFIYIHIYVYVYCVNAYICIYNELNWFYSDSNYLGEDHSEHIIYLAVTIIFIFTVNKNSLKLVGMSQVVLLIKVKLNFSFAFLTKKTIATNI
jgi:hypothetical protein